MIVIFFILGLIVGSFLNVVISRLHTAETILGHSKCPHCAARIRWYDNIPLLSFTILKMRCRDCGEKISWQYPLVELSTGIIFAATGLYFFSASSPQSWLETFYLLIAFSLLLIIFVYDLKFMEIPMIAVWLGVGLTVSYYLLTDWLNFNASSDIFSLNIFSGLLAGLGAFLFFFLLASVSKERWMGIGDAYAALLAGLIIKWPAILVALVMAFTIGAISGIILIALKKKTMQSQVPFAPFLVAGVFLTIFVPKIFPAIKYWFLYF
ncbi:MAG: prepilin peptidase [Candidatus Moranbacteria bacterium]|nr:prepilin peptidase [Candidatus Moranbacteria bacterium]